MTRKKATLALLCALMLALALGCAHAESAPAPCGEIHSGGEPCGNTTGEAPAEAHSRYFDEPSMGLRFRWPDVWYTALFEKQCLSPFGSLYGFGMDFYTNAGLEALDKLLSDPNLPENPDEYTPGQKQLNEESLNGTLPLWGIIAEKDGARDEIMRSRFTDATPLGEVNGTVYTMLTSPGTDLTGLSEEERAQYQALLDATKEFEKEMTLSGMKDLSEVGDIALEGNTLNGEPIDSTVLQNYKITAINIWATWCGPCVAELPELQKLYEALPEGANLLGICTDGEGEAELAKKIQDQCGVTFSNIAANQAMLEGFLQNVQTFPTTIFVDSKGNLVGEPKIGAPSGVIAAGYRTLIEERLALLNQE